MSSKPPLPSGRYKYIFGTKTNYTNDTGHWCVVVGMDQAGFNGDTGIVTVTVASVVVDGLLMKTFGVAADEIIVMLPRHLLVPPGAIVSSTSVVGFTMIECKSLEDALAIL